MHYKTGSGYISLTVPYGLLQYAVRCGDFNEIQILLAAKGLFGNSFDDGDITSISSLCRLHPKTILKHIANLKERNWIGIDPVSGRSINRGWRFIRIAVKDISTVGYTIPVNKLHQFKSFAVATCYDHLIAIQQYRSWLDGRERSKKGTSQQTGLQSKGFYPIANLAFSKIFNVSEATASRYRKLAVDAGYLELDERLLPTNLEGEIKTHRANILKYTGRALVYRKDQYWIQGITHVRSKMVRKRISSLQEKNECIRKGNS